jgi:hypothetical protein
MVALVWLRRNAYEDVADLIDLVKTEIEAAGRKTRRNWWDTLAGGTDGKPIRVNGHEFPVLRVAQIRQGKPVTPDAICRNEHEQPPDVIATHRWPRRRLPSKVKRATTKVARHQNRQREAS